MKDVTLHTDGACRGNPGPGGYGVVLLYGKRRHELSGGFRKTTNNRMELMAAIKGLEVLKEQCKVALWSDSRYVVDALSEGWAVRWRKNGWRRNKKEPAINPDLWGKLLDICESHDVTFNWVRGHSGNPENERCDQLATEAADQPNLPADEEYEAREQALQQQILAGPPQVVAESPSIGLAQHVRSGLSSQDASRRRGSILRAVEEQLTDLGPDLLALMESERDPDLKGRCAWALGRINYREAYPNLVNSLDHRSRALRTWSAWALGELGDDRANASLSRALTREKSKDVKQAIGGALKKLGFESTRVHRSQLTKALQPPATNDPTLCLMVERLEQREWPADSEQIIEVRTDMKRHDSDYFNKYMKWVERKPAIIAALEDDGKVFDT